MGATPLTAEALREARLARVRQLKAQLIERHERGVDVGLVARSGSAGMGAETATGEVARPAVEASVGSAVVSDGAVGPAVEAPGPAVVGVGAGQAEGDDGSAME